MNTEREHRASPDASAKKLVRSQKGNALVEFALILPVFLSLFMAMVTFSLALYNKIILTMATREGARAGAISSSTTDAITAAEDARSGLLLSFAAIPASMVTAGKSGGNIIVRAGFDYTGLPFLLVPDTVLSHTFPITAETTMMLESP